MADTARLDEPSPSPPGVGARLVVSRSVPRDNRLLGLSSAPTGTRRYDDRLHHDRRTTTIPRTTEEAGVMTLARVHNLAISLSPAAIQSFRRAQRARQPA